MPFYLRHRAAKRVVRRKMEALCAVVGCGHPGIVEVVRHAQRLTGEKVHAVVVGLHLPVSRGRTGV